MNNKPKRGKPAHPERRYTPRMLKTAPDVTKILQELKAQSVNINQWINDAIRNYKDKAP